MRTISGMIDSYKTPSALQPKRQIDKLIFLETLKQKT